MKAPGDLGSHEPVSTGSRAATVACLCSGGVGEEMPVVGARALVVLFELVPLADGEPTTVHPPARAEEAQRRLGELIAQRADRARDEGDDGLARDLGVLRELWEDARPGADVAADTSRMSIWEELRAPAGPRRAVSTRMLVLSVAFGVGLTVVLVLGAVAYAALTGTL